MTKDSINANCRLCPNGNCTAVIQVLISARQHQRQRRTSTPYIQYPISANDSVFPSNPRHFNHVLFYCDSSTPKKINKPKKTIHPTRQINKGLSTQSRQMIWRKLTKVNYKTQGSKALGGLLLSKGT